jgi:uncharacterized hydantoinase/oxoprolinase family protein
MSGAANFIKMKLKEDLLMNVSTNEDVVPVSDAEQDIDVNKYERLSNITLRHKLK